MHRRLARHARGSATRRKASKYAARKHSRAIARRARKYRARMHRRQCTRIPFVAGYALRAARGSHDDAPDGSDRPRKKFFFRRRIDALEHANCAKLRNFCGRANASRASGDDAREQNSGRFFCATRGDARARSRQCSSLSISSAYASGSSSSSVSSARLLGLTVKIQPSPNASSLIVSGLSASALLTATTLPETGA